MGRGCGLILGSCRKGDGTDAGTLLGCRYYRAQVRQGTEAGLALGGEGAQVRDPIASRTGLSCEKNVTSHLPATTTIFAVSYLDSSTACSAHGPGSARTNFSAFPVAAKPLPSRFPHHLAQRPSANKSRPAIRVTSSSTKARGPWTGRALKTDLDFVWSESSDPHLRLLVNTSSSRLCRCSKPNY